MQNLHDLDADLHEALGGHGCLQQLSISAKLVLFFLPLPKPVDDSEMLSSHSKTLYTHSFILYLHAPDRVIHQMYQNVT